MPFPKTGAAVVNEHFFTRRSGYAITLCDLRNHKIHDGVYSREGDSIRCAYIEWSAHDGGSVYTGSDRAHTGSAGNTGGQGFRLLPAHTLSNPKRTLRNWRLAPYAANPPFAWFRNDLNV
jgi:hypothetical protein